jgi:hypothetical protein
LRVATNAAWTSAVKRVGRPAIPWLYLQDAASLYRQRHVVDARARALKSLQYSVGMFHEDYVRAAEDASAWQRLLRTGIAPKGRN